MPLPDLTPQMPRPDPLSPAPTGPTPAPGPLGAPPGGAAGPLGPPPPWLAALASLAKVAPLQREKVAAQDAAARLQIAMAGASLRSAKAAEHFSVAYREIQKGIQVLEELGTAPVPPPPNLLGGLTGSPSSPFGQSLPGA